MIDAAAFAEFAPHADPALAALIDAAAPSGGINTALRCAHWMAQMAVECAYFSRFEENLDYSAPRIVAVWPSRFDAASAAAVAHNPRALANAVYGGRMGNGAPGSGDGWTYRGRGPLMDTGREAYANLAAVAGRPLLEQPDLLADPATGFLVAASFWMHAGCNALADADDLEAVTRRINGGLTDLDLRTASLIRAKEIWR